MTVDDFVALCEREWDNGHGDVDRLWITKESWEELETSMMLRSGDEHTPWFKTFRVTAEWSENLENPITKTPIWIRPAGDRDVAECALPGGGGRTILL